MFEDMIYVLDFGAYVFEDKQISVYVKYYIVSDPNHSSKLHFFHLKSKFLVS